MKYLSVCSGVEAATLAWHPLGWEPVGFSEIEKFPSAVLAHRWPNVPSHGDFTTITEKEHYASARLLVGGTPCQAFSVAGLRKGLKDERGNLSLEYIRLAFRAGVRWIVWENVPGVLTSHGGADFACFLSGLTGVDITVPPKLDGKKGWRNSGIIVGRPDHYSIAWRVLDAQYLGVPQQRRRVFVVGYLGGDWRRAAAVLFERESLSGNPAPSRKAGKGFTHDVAPCIGASGRGFERAGETRGQDPVVADIAGPCTAGMSHPRGTETVESNHLAVRRLTPIECERLQGFPDNHTRIPWRGKPAEDCPDGPRYKAIGNSMAVPVMRWIGEGIDYVDKMRLV